MRHIIAQRFLVTKWLYEQFPLVRVRFRQLVLQLDFIQLLAVAFSFQTMRIRAIRDFADCQRHLFRVVRGAGGHKRAVTRQNGGRQRFADATECRLLGQFHRGRFRFITDGKFWYINLQISPVALLFLLELVILRDRAIHFAVLKLLDIFPSF